MKKKTNEVGDLKKHIGFWMRFVSNHVSYAFARKLAQSGVTVAEWVVLREMYQAGQAVAPSVVSKSTGHTRGAISKLIDRLVKKNFINRKGAKDDKRYQEVTLTAKAQKLVPVLASLADKNDEEFFAVLSTDERKALTGLLQKVVELNQLKKLPTK